MLSRCQPGPVAPSCSMGESSRDNREVIGWNRISVEGWGGRQSFSGTGMCSWERCNDRNFFLTYSLSPCWFLLLTSYEIVILSWLCLCIRYYGFSPNPSKIPPSSIKTGCNHMDAQNMFLHPLNLQRIPLRTIYKVRMFGSRFSHRLVAS